MKRSLQGATSLSQEPQRNAKPKTDADGCPILALPADILGLIFHFFPPRTCGRVLTLVCRRWRDLAHRSITRLHLRHPSAAVPLLPSVTEMHVEIRSELPTQFFPHLRSLSVLRNPSSTSAFSSLLRYTDLTSLRVDMLDAIGTTLISLNAHTLTSLRINRPIPQKSIQFIDTARLSSLRALEIRFGNTALPQRFLVPLASQLIELHLTDFNALGPLVPIVIGQRYPQLQSLSLYTWQLLSLEEIADLTRNSPQLTNFRDLGWLPFGDIGIRHCLTSIQISGAQAPYATKFVEAFRHYSRLTELTVPAYDDASMTALQPICSSLRKLRLVTPLPGFLAACAPYLVELDLRFHVDEFAVPKEFPCLRRLTLRDVRATPPLHANIRALVTSAPMLSELEFYCLSEWPDAEMTQYLKQCGPKEGYTTNFQSEFWNAYL